MAKGTPYSHSVLTSSLSSPPNTQPAPFVPPLTFNSRGDRPRGKARMGRLERVTLDNFKSYPGTQVGPGEGGREGGREEGREGGKGERKT